jgi:hypothetical protein
VRQSPSKGQGVVGQKQEDLITIGFRVKPKENAIIQDFVNRLYSQFVVDPNTNEPKRMLDYPSIELVIKRVTFSYVAQFNWFEVTVRTNLEWIPRHPKLLA